MPPSPARLHERAVLIAVLVVLAIVLAAAAIATNRPAAFWRELQDRGTLLLG
jgi:hypothetical protein